MAGLRHNKRPTPLHQRDAGDIAPRFHLPPTRYCLHRKAEGVAHKKGAAKEDDDGLIFAILTIVGTR